MGHFDRASFVIRGDQGVGAVEVNEDTVAVKLGHAVTIKKNYVASLEKTADLALSRANAVLSYYDMFGNKESISFIINDNDLRALKKRLGK